MNRQWRGVGWAALSGLLFGTINVGVKRLGVDPFWQAALAYLAVAAVLAPFARGLRVPRRDRVRMGAMAVLGGGLAPVLLFHGLRETTAVDSGLILTLELVVTTVLAAVFLKERERAAGWAGLGLLLAAAVIVPLAGAADADRRTTVAGAALVALAAAAWGVDNMLSTRLVGSYRLEQLLAVKGALGGTLVLAAALATQAPLPDPERLGGAIVVGGLGLALSLLCFYRALQSVGASRTAAVNIPMTALASAAGGTLLLGERLGPWHALALALVVAGVMLLVRPQGSSTSPE